jgi:hypothetical protein
MRSSPTGHADDTTRASPDELTELAASWRRGMRAQRMSAATIATYTIAVGQLHAFLLDNGMPTSPAGIRREHIEAFVEDLLTRWKPATAHNRYRGCQAFFRWLVDEGEIRESPMARMKPPGCPRRRRRCSAKPSSGPSWRPASETRRSTAGATRRSSDASSTRARAAGRSSV